MREKNTLQKNDVFHSDAPINVPQQDLFERNEFVSELKENIIQFKSKNSLVIALYGPWGSGKTSVLNLIDTALAGEKNLRVLNFDPWYFNSQEQLIQTFLSTVLSEAIKIVSKDEASLKQNLELYGLSFASAFSASPKIEAMGIGVDFGTIKALQNFKEPGAVKEKLKKNLVNKNIKFVILIDNLDRLEPSELLLMFKLVKLCADFPNFVYVLAFDHKQAEKILKKQDVDPEFLAKIVQVDIELPNIEQYRVDEFVFQNLRDIAIKHEVFMSGETWKRFEDSYRLAVSGILVDDLRKAKRFINSVSFSISLVKSGLDFSDFILLEILRIFNPQIYGLLPFYKKALTNFIINDLSMRPFYVLRKKMSASTDITLKPVYETIVGILFPPFRQFCIKPGEIWHGRSDRKHIVEQRICAEEIFDQYFQFKTPKESISKSIINEIVKGLNDGTVDSPQLAQFFLQSDKEDKLALALARFELMLQLRNDQARRTIIDAIITVSPQLSLTWDSELSIGSSGQIASSLLETCLDGFADKEKSLTHIIMKADFSFIYFASHRIIFGNRPNNTWLLGGPLEPQPIPYALDALRQRFYQEFINGDRNIFIEFPETYIGIIDLWEENFGNTNKEEFQDYIYRQVTKDARALPRLINAFSSSIKVDNSMIKAPYTQEHRNEVFKVMAREKLENWFDLNKIINEYKMFLVPEYISRNLTSDDIYQLSLIDISDPLLKPSADNSSEGGIVFNL